MNFVSDTDPKSIIAASAVRYFPVLTWAVINKQTEENMRSLDRVVACRITCINGKTTSKFVRRSISFRISTLDGSRTKFLAKSISFSGYASKCC